MFEDDSGANNSYTPDNNYAERKNQKTILIVVGIVFFIIIIVVATAISMKNADPKTNQQTQTNSQVSNNTVDTSTPNIPNQIIPKLPTIAQTEGTEIDSNLDTNQSQVDILSFGNFYNPDQEAIVSTIEQIQLPMNIKEDVSNYHDLARKINLDPYIDDLNNNGFAVMDNPFAKEANDFFGIYELLPSKNIPTLLTSDFLIYYYQNTLKDIFKNTEEEIFYDDLWDVTKELFDRSNARYQEKLRIPQSSENTLLEASRLEAAFFATALEILKPKQDSTKNMINKDNQFSVSEMSKYNQTLPPYFQNDIPQEIKLIYESKKITKSPVLLYTTDYTKFNLPEEYKNNPKLTNFYLTSIWLSSVFPTYYKGPDCPDCLLDKNDWTINQIASHYIAQDLSKDQKIKNQWATIYKVLSYFNGLKKGSDYIDINNNYKTLFDEESIEDVLSNKNPEKNNNLTNLQKEITKKTFKTIDGGLDTTDKKNQRLIGMRLLQEQYWPNDYIFKKLSIEAGNHKETYKQHNKPITACIDGKAIATRCKAIGLDIINLITDIPKTNKYFYQNTNYENYKNLSTDIKNELRNFNVFNWHSNNYWNSLSIMKTFIDQPEYETPNYSKQELWKTRKINTALATWTNLHLAQDIWSQKTEKTNSFNASSMLDIYIEPELELPKELKANAEMLRDMLLALKVIDKNNYLYTKLTNLIERLSDVILGIKSELTNQKLEHYDLKNLDDFIKKYEISQQIPKTIEFKFANNFNKVTEDISGVKLLIITHIVDEGKKFSVGPIYNYKEY
ncbi:DUF3160 domain-containing protein [Patescibacteria group bacterium]|nr:DUF3160 domain-containing protein [Patescibacteria group bacterium]